MHLSREQILGYVVKLVARHQSLERELTDAMSAERKNPQSYQQLTKQLSAIRNVAVRYQRFQSNQADLAEAQAMCESKDPDTAALGREELPRLLNEESELLRYFEDYWIDQHQEPERPFMMEIRAGTGGDEASLFAADLYRMYTRYASENKWSTQVLNSSQSEAGGFKEIVFAVKGDGSWRHLKYESGVHRVQRVPATEASGRIHTSTATVAVLPEPEDVELPTIPIKDLQIDVYRSSGPGGQGVNTTDSAVRIHHIPTGLIVTCQDERSQLQNREAAMRVLRARLLDKIRQEQAAERASDRRAQVGTGERSEKIRTYNFPDRRVTDHRIGLTLHKLDTIIEGGLDELVGELIAHERDALVRKALETGHSEGADAR